MFKTEYIDLQESGVLNPLVLDYIKGKKTLETFYNHFPDPKGFAELIQKDIYSELNRNQLHQILLLQAKSAINTSELSYKHIDKLQLKNTYTVTTGHQLCLFTGPLYFIYKILSTINLADTLKQLHPDHDFVPVYWMASEDHDFEEVNHFNLYNKKIIWSSQQSGAVGEFSTDELHSLLPEIAELFGFSEKASELLDLFKKSYLMHKNLSSATRYLVNALFGEFGLVIADGNDKAFKKQMAAIFKDDIFNNTSHKNVIATNQQLEQLQYPIQVNPRLINCFYMDNGQRNRIEQKDGKFHVVGTSLVFTPEEMIDMIDKQPENISPNVVLRPLYQQKILPNLAYVGGPGELSYWLEFKSMFDHYKINFPILTPRKFISVIEKSISEKIKKLNLTHKDLFLPESDLVKRFMEKSAGLFELEKEKEKLSELYSIIQEKITLVDKSLTGSVSAEMQKSINGIQNLVSKANKALKQKSETEINQIKNLKLKFFPNGQAQERFDNFSSLYLKYGKSFIHEIKMKIEPFDMSQLLLLES